MQNWYEIGGIRTGIRTTSERFGRVLDDVLSGYKVEPADETPAYGVVLPDGAEGGRDAEKRFNILYRGSEAVVRTLDPSLLIRSILSELESHLFPERDDAIYLDAALIWSNGTAALVPPRVASSLGGLGGRVERAGLVLPAETYVAVDEASGRVEPIRPKLRIDGDALEVLRGHQSGTRGAARRAVDHPCVPDIVCSFGQTEGTLAPASRARVLSRHVANVVNLTALGVRAVEGLARLAEGARCYEMAWSEPRAMLETVMTAFRTVR